MLAFLEEGVQQEWAVSTAWLDRVSKDGSGAEKGVGRRGVAYDASGWCRADPGQVPNLISWEGFSAFWVLKMSVSCSSRCLSCSQVESLLQMKDSGHSLNTL